jgi:CheY-like chemotaxis protein
MMSLPCDWPPPTGRIQKFVRWERATENGPTPVIAMSGYEERQEPRLAAAPFARKLLKPLNFDQLCAEIAVVLSNRA